MSKPNGLPIENSAPGTMARGTAPAAPVQIEIGSEVLEKLFEDGALCAADFRCLNNRTKICIRAICLRNCARQLHRSR